MNRRSMLLAVALLLPALGCAGPALAVSPVEAAHLTELKKEIELFESIINTSLNQYLPNPLFLSEVPRGALLDGYGLAFSYTINLNRSLTLFPKPANPSARDKDQLTANAVVLDVQRNMTMLLGQYAATFKHLPSNANICIIAHVLSRPRGTSLSGNRVVVVSTSRKDAELYQRGKISFDEFKKRVDTLEY